LKARFLIFDFRADRAAHASLDETQTAALAALVDL